MHNLKLSQKPQPPPTLNLEAEKVTLKTAWMLYNSTTNKEVTQEWQLSQTLNPPAGRITKWIRERKAIAAQRRLEARE